MPRAAKPVPASPDALQGGGRALWDSCLEIDPTMQEHRKRILLEACRIADRLDAIDAGLGRDYAVLDMIEVTTKDGDIISYTVAVERALATAKGLAEQMNKLIATLRLPTTFGVPAERRGNPGSTRGPYKTGGAKKPSALERALGSVG